MRGGEVVCRSQSDVVQSRNPEPCLVKPSTATEGLPLKRQDEAASIRKPYWIHQEHVLSPTASVRCWSSGRFLHSTSNINAHEPLLWLFGI